MITRHSGAILGYPGNGLEILERKCWLLYADGASLIQSVIGRSCVTTLLAQPRPNHHPSPENSESPLRTCMSVPCCSYATGFASRLDLRDSRCHRCYHERFCVTDHIVLSTFPRQFSVLDFFQMRFIVNCFGF